MRKSMETLVKYAGRMSGIIASGVLVLDTQQAGGSQPGAIAPAPQTMQIGVPILAAMIISIVIAVIFFFVSDRISRR